MDRESKINQKLEIYKLHAELAERVSASRENLPNVYSRMVVSVIGISIIIYRFAPGLEIFIKIMPYLVIIVCASWILSSISITGRLGAKFQTLIEIEECLSFDFIRRENQKFEERRYIRRKYTGLILPVILIICCFIFSYIQNKCEIGSALLKCNFLL